jgi:undecaprenyl-diphosphatase
VKPVWIVVAVAVALFAAVRWRRISNRQRVLAALVIAAAAVYGAGAVHLPNLEKTIEDAGSTLGAWTYLLVGLFAFLETGAFVGLLVPGETAMLLGGVVAGQGRISIVVVIAIAWAAAVLGDTTSFFLGRRLGRGFLVRHGPRFGITEERLEHVEAFFDRHGGPTILIGRFVGLVRAIAPFIAGSSRMSFARFLPYDVVGAGAWASALLLLGFVFWHSFSQLVDIAKRGAFALGLVIVLVVAAVVVYRHWRAPENRARAVRWIERQTGPLRFFLNRLTPGELGLELTVQAAVVAVGSFAFAGLAILLGEHRLGEFDGNALGTARDAHTGWGIDLAKAVTALGSLPVAIGVVIAGAAFLAWRRLTLPAIALAAGFWLSFGALQIAKAAQGRPRPAGSLVDTVGSSFPSGHAVYSVVWPAVAVAVALAVPRWGGRTALVATGLVVAAAVGLTRVYLGAHYLTDVIAGWGLGAAIYAACGMVAVVVAFVRQNGRARA